MDPAIEVEHLTRHFKVPVRDTGLGASLRSFFQREFRLVRAVEDVSFRIQPGEVVGFLGPNGAGKTTALKMLAGVLYPTSGRAAVVGFVPHERRREFLSQITFIMGQRTQLLWDIPPLDSYAVNQALYRVPDREYRSTLAELTELLELQDLLHKPVRQMALGERMKCEIAAGLLHRPKILFLDEPTLRLDVAMQNRIRRFVAEYNRRHGATILLTSHYMADVTALCERVILIHRGRLIHDGELRGLARRLAPYKLVRVSLIDGRAGDVARYSEVLESKPDQVVLRVPQEDAAAVTQQILASGLVSNLNLEDPPIEAVIEKIYGQGRTA